MHSNKMFDAIPIILFIMNRGTGTGMVCLV